ncbi:MAG: M20/M25/M40 family metallo-hydrolase [Candidatus Nitronauta litoralis]|uniref:M20/M25/M40 family metallo-hydrolase n=1 Tax=Candidatus Nitronauta litoralis TaxID=2705533 RepID=A0A7T0G043_9BACT|nr:MAG: M20/M25/M40 family metallo-hydrolase [Candidatus Nitronauta litoralis]
MNLSSQIKLNLKEHLDAIVGERNPFTTPEKMDAVGQYIVDRFEEWELHPKILPVLFDDLESFNVQAKLPGKNPESPVILIGAHYDSVPDSPGADDNASAVAALLEIARMLSENPPAGPVILMGFALEEYGFVGSQYWADDAVKNNNKPDGMIALEMLGYTDKRLGAQKYPPGVDSGQYPDTGDFIAVVGNTDSMELVTSLTKGMKRTRPELGIETLVVPGKGEVIRDVRRSDHVPFWEAGIPAVMVTDTADFRNPHYHKATDTLDTLDLDFLTDVTLALAGFFQDN